MAKKATNNQKTRSAPPEVLTIFLITIGSSEGGGWSHSKSSYMDIVEAQTPPPHTHTNTHTQNKGGRYRIVLGEGGLLC